LALVGRLLMWAVFFGLVMTLGPKKFDRYLLPSLVALDLAVGVALVMAARHLPILRPSRPRPDTPSPKVGAGGWGAGAALALILLQAVAAAGALPYPMAYYNPLLGGATAAARVLLVGWGEGYDLAARWLNEQPGAAGLEASARSVTVFGPQFAGRTRSAEGYRPGRTDYVVLYRNQVQRRQNEDVVGVYWDDPLVQPAFVGRIGGLDYVWVYPNRSVAAVRAALAERVSPGDVVLADGEGVLARSWAGAVPLVRYWGHWGEAEMREALARDFPPDWRRAWVVRYPGQDPDVARAVLGMVAGAGDTVTLADGAVELTLFTRGP
jgi:hypothetical protein